MSFGKHAGKHILDTDPELLQRGQYLIGTRAIQNKRQRIRSREHRNQRSWDRNDKSEQTQGMSQLAMCRALFVVRNLRTIGIRCIRRTHSEIGMRFV